MISVHPLWNLEWNASIEWLLPRGLKSCSSKSTFTFTIILQQIRNQAKTNVRKFFRDDGQLFKRSKYKKNNFGFARRKHVSMLIEQNILYATITLVLYNYSAQENFIKNKSISEEWNNSVFFFWPLNPWIHFLLGPITWF